MRRLSSNALPGIMLVIVIFWALFAVLLLTGILSTANRIESRVGVIKNEVVPINNKLDVVPILSQVSDTASQIRDAAAPLTGIIGHVVDSAASIDTSAKQILGTAQQINTSAKSINGTVLEINTSVHSIAPQLVTILDSAESINGSVHTINKSFDGIVSNVYDIRGRIVLASAQVDAIIRLVQGIKGDTGFISDQVDDINENALGIETSPLLLNYSNAGMMREMAKAGGQGPAAQAGLPALDLLPPLPALGLPTMPLPVVGQLPFDLSKILQGLPLLGDTGDLLGMVGAGPK
jgi:hypothetical protein